MEKGETGNFDRSRKSPRGFFVSKIKLILHTLKFSFIIASKPAIKTENKNKHKQTGNIKKL